MARWMIENGAKNIVLLSRSGALKGKAKDQVDAWNEAGANVVVRNCDVADRADVDGLIQTGLLDMPPVRGIIHGAMVLHVRNPEPFICLQCLYITRMSSSKK
jgi:NAD(P)-dependent dehydrogenase (short-subunit alcohol dehydrogenase family)